MANIFSENSFEMLSKYYISCRKMLTKYTENRVRIKCCSYMYTALRKDYLAL